MRFRIGEKVIHRNKVKTIKSFCECCAKLLSNGEYVIKRYGRVRFEEGGDTTIISIKKTGQLLFNFMYKE